MMNFIFRAGIRIVTLICWLSLSFAGSAVTNDWIKSGSGNWEEASAWSSGVPGPGQDLVAIRNAGWKAVGIDANTTTTAATSLQILNLRIDAPVDSFNELLLNWGGTAVPLSVQSNIFVGPHGALSSHSSGLVAGALIVSNGSVSLLDASAASIGSLTLQSQGQFKLSTSVLLTLSNSITGNFTHESGTHYISTMQLPGEPAWPASPVGSYFLQSGVVLSSNIIVGPTQMWSHDRDGTFEQTGGAHTNTVMNLRGWLESVRYGGYEVHRSGVYKLLSGTFQSDNVEVSMGAFFQKGGSSKIGNLSIAAGGLYTLGSGELVTSNVVLSQIEPYYSTAFEQTGGVHTVQEVRMAGAPNYRRIGYQLSGGQLNVGTLMVHTSSVFTVTGGELVNSEVSLRSGEIEVGSGMDVRFGKLDTYYATLDMDPAGYEGPSSVRFDDSSSVAWEDINGLQIEHWNPTYDHIYFGTNGQGLTASQLGKITFWRPRGWPVQYPYGTYPASILPTGEVVPTGAGVFGDFTYVVLEGTAVITGYRGSAGRMEIPWVINNYTVTQIGDSAFLDSGVITEAVIPGSVKKIGVGAFENCTNLASVTLSDGLLSIEYDAFARCSQLQAVNIPHSVTNVGWSAFMICTNLQSVVFGVGVKEIESHMFMGCTALKSVVFPPALQFVGSSSFYFCSALQNLTLPESVYGIGDLAFYGTGLTNFYLPAATTNAGLDSIGYCTNLLSINVAPENPAYRSIDGVLFDKSAKTLLKYATGRPGPYTVPYGVETIYNWVFQHSPYLTAIYIPETVTYIAYSVFDHCPSLKGVYFYGAAPSIGDPPSIASDAVLYYMPGTPGWPLNNPYVKQEPWRLPYPIILSDTPEFGINSNEFRFRISWGSNAPVVIDAATSLAGPWTPVSTNSLSNGWMLFSQPVQSNEGGHFYRVRGL